MRKVFLISFICMISTLMAGCVVITGDTANDIQGVVSQVQDAVQPVMDGVVGTVQDVTNKLDVQDVKEYFTVDGETITKIVQKPAQIPETTLYDTYQKHIGEYFGMKYCVVPGKAITQADAEQEPVYNVCNYSNDITGVYFSDVQVRLKEQEATLDDMLDMYEYIQEGSTWYELNKLKRTRSICNTPVNYPNIEKLLYEIPKKQNYYSIVGQELYKKMGLNVEVYVVDGEYYLYTYNKKGELSAVFCVNTQLLYQIESYTLPENIQYYSANYVVK